MNDVNEQISKTGIATLDTCGLREVALYFQALGEPTRLRIVAILKANAARTKDLAGILNTSSANISRHLALLERQGIVVRHRENGATVYSLPDQTIKILLEMVPVTHKQQARGGITAK